MSSRLPLQNVNFVVFKVLSTAFSGMFKLIDYLKDPFVAKVQNCGSNKALFHTISSQCSFFKFLSILQFCNIPNSMMLPHSYCTSDKLRGLQASTPPPPFNVNNGVFFAECFQPSLLIIIIIYQKNINLGDECLCLSFFIIIIISLFFLLCALIFVWVWGGGELIQGAIPAKTTTYWGYSFVPHVANLAGVMMLWPMTQSI